MKYKLKDVCNFYSGTGFPTKYQGEIEGDYPFYKVGDITNNVIAGNIYLEMCNNYVSINTVKKIKGCVLPPNTVVFAKIGEALKLNRRAITSCACLIDNNAMGIAPKEDTLRIQYFYFFMKNLKMQVLAESTTVPSVRKTILEDYEVEIPSLNIQEEIESRLTITQDIIEKRKKELSLLDNLIKARFVEMFGNPRLNEKGFKCKKGFELFKISNGKAVSNEKRFESGIPAYGGNGISWYTNTVLFEEDTIVIGRVGFQSGNVHFVKGPMWITDNAMYISELYDDSLSLVFLCDMMEQIDFTRDQDAGDLKKVTQKPFMEMEYILPEKSLQKEYIDFVHQVDKSKVAVQKALDETKLLFDSLMQKYFG